MLYRLVPTLALHTALIVGLPHLAGEETDGGTSIPPIPMTTANDETIEITASRLSLDPYDQPYAFYRHDKNELIQNVGRTAIDRINYGPGVFIQHTAPGQASPFIRGLTGNQTLIMIDGVRLSHATMRGGPNEYTAFVPNMSVSSIDVILGSSGVANGSDGLTGTLDMRLEQAGRGVDVPASAWAETRLDSANGLQLAAGIDGAQGDWLYSFESSLYKFHDRVGGKDMDDHIFGSDKNAYNEIPNTAYDQYAWAGRSAYIGAEDHRLEFSLGSTRQHDAPRPDGYAENSGISDRISRYYDSETFNYLHLRHIWTPHTGSLKSLRSTAWWHQFDEEQRREDLTSGSTVYRRREYDDTTDSIGLDLQATNRVEQHELIYGATIIFEQTGNDYREYRNLGGVDPSGATPFQSNTWDTKTSVTDGAEYNTYAIFAQDLWHLSDEWDLLGGLRYTFVDWDFDVASSDAQDVTGSLRATWFFEENMRAFTGLSKGFRAPNLIDLDGASDRASSGTPAFGNPDLDPEISYTIEAGWRYEEEKDNLAVSIFMTRIEDIIQTVYPSGGGPGTTENAESADLQGFELAWNYGIADAWLNGSGRLAVIGSLSYVDTEIEVPQTDGSTLKEPLSRANRIYGILGLRYDLPSNWWTKAQFRFHDAYDSDDIAAGDAGDVRLTVPGDSDGRLPGWAVFDIAAGWQTDDKSRWTSVTIENLADKTYREVGSGTDAAGFNLILAGGVRF